MLATFGQGNSMQYLHPQRENECVTLSQSPFLKVLKSLHTVCLMSLHFPLKFADC